MKKVNFFTQKRFRVIKNEELQVCAKWFTDNNFFFFTKRPDSLIPGTIDGILCGAIVFTNEKDKPVGLLRYDSEFFGNENCSVCEFRFQDPELYTNSLGERLLYSFLYYNFFSSNKYLKKILFRVYAFDQWNMGLFAGIDILPEAVLKEHIYKNGRFHDLCLFGISRQEFLQTNGLDR